jgi:AcrR family transcriptional regulator
MVELMENVKDEEVKKSILDAASRVFQKWGLNKTTMEDIAREAGKGKSTLYYYYPSKEEIFHNVVTNEFTQMLLIAQLATADVRTAKEKLRKYIVTCIVEIKKCTNVYGIVRGEIKGNHELLEKIKVRFTSIEEAFVKEVLAYGVQTNEFTFADEKELDSAAKVAVGILHAMEQYLFVENYDSDHVDLAARMIANGI